MSPTVEATLRLPDPDAIYIQARSLAWTVAFTQAVRRECPHDRELIHLAVRAFCAAPLAQIPTDATEAAFLFVARAALARAIRYP